MTDRKRRKDLGLPEEYLYTKDTKSITFKDFINKELVLFSNMDNERSIPNVVDGLKPGSRKVSYHFDSLYQLINSLKKKSLHFY